MYQMLLNMGYHKIDNRFHIKICRIYFNGIFGRLKRSKNPGAVIFVTAPYISFNFLNSGGFLFI